MPDFKAYSSNICINMFELERIDISCDFEAIYNQEIDEAKSSGKYQRLVLIVPKQSSHKVEQIVARHLGGVGFNGVEVMTFRQIIRTFVNRDEDTYLDGTGLNLLAYRAMQERLDECSVFRSAASKPGFICDASNMISELLRYGISPEQLKGAKVNKENSLLNEKLEAFSKIYEEYNRLFSSHGFTTAEDDTYLACKAITEGDYFKNTKVWFSLFTDFVPQEQKIIEAIANAGADVCVHLFTPPEGSTDTTAFDSLVNMESKLCDLLKVHNIVPIQTSRYIEATGIASDINFVRKNFFNNKRLNSCSENQVIIASHGTVFDEVMNVAKTIETWVRKDDLCRYGDIGIVCADFDAYAPVIKTIFDEFNIPIFSDYKESVLNHPVAILIRAVFDIMDTNFQTTDVIRLLRSGLVLNEWSVDRIDTVATALGIRGGMWNKEEFWHKKKNYSRTEEDTQETELVPEWELTRGVVDALTRLYERTKHKAVPKHHSEALFDFFDDINLYDNITKKINFLRNVDYDNAVYFSKIWNWLIKLTEQICVVLADVECSFADFGMYLNMGLASVAISLIPQGVDRVSVSSFGKTSGEPVKVLFLLGATRDGLVGARSNNSVFTERERETLEENGVKMSAYGVHAINEQKLVTYRTIIRALDRLVISYPTTNEDGAVLAGSPLIDDIKQKFVGLKVHTGDSLWDDVTSKNATAHNLLQNTTPARYTDKTWLAVAEWFRVNEPAVMARFDIAREKLSKTGTDVLFEKYIDELYGNDSLYSISKIQAYFDCPYKYFLQSGLRLKEREVYSVGMTDIGTIVHDCIEKYCRAVDGVNSTPEQKKARWDSLTDEESKKLVSDVMSSASGMLRQNAHNERILERIKKIVLRSVKVINQEFKIGKFVSGEYEWNFDDLKFSDNERTITFHGIVDRYDVYQSPNNGKTYIRIFDYKTGNHKYSELDITRLIDIQLVVYALAVAQKLRESSIGECDTAGMFYENTKNEFSNVDIAEINGETEQDKPLDGTIYYDLEKGGNANHELFEAFDRDIYSCDSLYGVKFKKDGEPVKNGFGKIANPYERFDYLGRWVEEKSLEADKGIRSGNIKMYPYAKTRLHNNIACKSYCPYVDICTSCQAKKKEFREAEDDKFAAVVAHFGGQN